MPPAVKRTIPLLLAVVLVACQPGNNNRPVPSVPVIGADLHCLNGDHGYEDQQVGWGFCYPGTWKYNERSQSSSNPPGLDLTFDITDVPCSTPSAAPGAPSVRPSCSPDAGLFAFMIISTYERGGASDILAWVQTNMKPVPTILEPIQWGNSVEADRFADGRRIALTPNHVVILDMRSGQGQLDLEAQMSSRLGTWKFTS